MTPTSNYCVREIQDLQAAISESIEVEQEEPTIEGLEQEAIRQIDRWYGADHPRDASSNSIRAAAALVRLARALRGKRS
jgi:low affinity Fe/Cu permease